MFVIGYHCPLGLQTPDAVVALLRGLVDAEVVSAVDWDGARGTISCTSSDACVVYRFHPDGWLNLLLESETGAKASHIENNANIALFFAGAVMCTGLPLPETLWWVESVLAESPPTSPGAKLAWCVGGLWCHAAEVEAIGGDKELVLRLRSQAFHTAEELSSLIRRDF